jgi:A/G-specific adenine glycosylase
LTQRNPTEDSAVRTLQTKLLAWYATCRRDLPWRRTRDPWAIWVSEIMLQQTRVETVKPYFERFMARFPTPLALAETPEDGVLAAWSGLGYYRRARMLHAGAKHVAFGSASSSASSSSSSSDNQMPASRDALLALPGVGRYTAGAIASIAYGEAVSLVDGNVARVLARVFLIEEDIKKTGMRRAETIAETLVDAKDPGAWNQALMELGATICTPRSPSCDRCPIAASSCQAYAKDRVASLPLVGAKTKPKAQRVQALVATHEGRILLARRRSEGLFGGLWEPPSIDGSRRTKQTLIDRFPMRATTEHRGSVVHVLSHRRLTVDVHVGELAADVSRGSASAFARKPLVLPEVYEAADLFDPTALEGLGVSTLARKVLAKAREASEE